MLTAFGVTALTFMMVMYALDARFILAFALGVKPEYQHTGTAAAFYVNVWETCLASNVRPGRDRVDPGDERPDEPRDGGARGRRGQALSGL